MDGNALRGTGEHGLTVFVGRLRLTVWQEQLDTKENEFPALEESLARRQYLLHLKAPHQADQKIAGQVVT